MSTMTIAQAINNAIYLEMENDPNVLLLGEDIGHVGKRFFRCSGRSSSSWAPANCRFDVYRFYRCSNGPAFQSSCQNEIHVWRKG